MSENRTDIIAFRMTPDEKFMLTNYADKSHMRVSEYLRALVGMGMVIEKQYKVEEEERHHCVVPLEDGREK